jgi:hypothetical protein
MPFAAIDHRDFVSQLQVSLSDDRFWNDSEAVDQANLTGTKLVSEFPDDIELHDLVQRFQSKFHVQYSQKHSLQSFLNQLVRHVLRSKSDSPISELIAAIDRKIVQ